MSRTNSDAIAQAILEAPAWARVGITAPSEWLRKDAAQELARAIMETVWTGPEESDAGGSTAVQLSFLSSRNAERLGNQVDGVPKYTC